MKFLAASGFGTEACQFELLSGGNSHVTWLVKLGTGQPPLVVKIAQPDGPLAPYNVGHEARMMDLAHKAGVAAPALVGYVQEGDLQFIVMHQVAGDSPSLWEVRRWLEGQPVKARLDIGQSLLSVLRPMGHAAPAGADALPDSYRSYLDGLILNLEQSAAGVIELPQSIRQAHAWLEAKVDRLDGPPVLHHGDFRLGNAVFVNGQIAAMLDWERAMTGHPLHDLGFLCLPAMRIGDHVCGLFAQEELEMAWRELTGEALNRELLSYFLIMSIFSELCYMIRAMVRLVTSGGRLTAARTLPLIPRLHHDMILSIRKWNDGNFTL